VRREEVLKTQFRAIEGKISYEEFVVHVDWLLGLIFLFPGTFPNHRVSNQH
jgi:hypothetical protein